MALVDHERVGRHLRPAWAPTTEASGGSAANTAAGVAALGGRAAFLGRVADDRLGRAFTHDIRSIGVAFDPTPTTAVPGEVVTGHCLVLVTEDAERTMATHLGVASEFGAVDLHDGHLASTQVVYLEGYLWEQADGQGGHAGGHRGGPRQRRRGGPHRLGPVLRRSTTAPNSSNSWTATSSSCSPTRRRSMMLFGTSTFDAAVDAVAETGVLAALTRGAQGSVVVTAVRDRRGARRAGRTGSSTPPGPATCSPPGSSTASPTGSDPRGGRPARRGVRGRGHLPRGCPSPGRPAGTGRGGRPLRLTAGPRAGRSVVDGVDRAEGEGQVADADQ